MAKPKKQARQVQPKVGKGKATAKPIKPKKQSSGRIWKFLTGGHQDGGV